MTRQTIAALAIPLVLLSTAPAAAFSFSFDWSGLKSCTSGRPNTVKNPAFRVRGLPKGTQSVVFRMKDLNVPRYNHGGGTVAMTKSGTVKSGAFRYKSPCPPGGRHTYQWTATAKSGARGSGKTLGVAKASRKYP